MQKKCVIRGGEEEDVNRKRRMRVNGVKDEEELEKKTRFRRRGVEDVVDRKKMKKRRRERKCEGKA